MGWEVYDKAALQGLRQRPESSLERGSGRLGPSTAKRALEQHLPSAVGSQQCWSRSRASLPYDPCIGRCSLPLVPAGKPLSSLSRDQSRAPEVEVQSLSQWTTKEVP